MMFGIMDGPDPYRYITTFGPECGLCRHIIIDDADTVRRCAAFPDGIPAEILDGMRPHDDAYPGDHGIRFEARERSG